MRRSLDGSANGSAQHRCIHVKTSTTTIVIIVIIIEWKTPPGRALQTQVKTILQPGLLHAGRQLQ